MLTPAQTLVAEYYPNALPPADLPINQPFPAELRRAANSRRPELRKAAVHVAIACRVSQLCKLGRKVGSFRELLRAVALDLYGSETETLPLEMHATPRKPKMAPRITSKQHTQARIASRREGLSPEDMSDTDLYPLQCKATTAHQHRHLPDIPPQRKPREEHNDSFPHAPITDDDVRQELNLLTTGEDLAEQIKVFESRRLMGLEVSADLPDDNQAPTQSTVIVFDADNPEYKRQQAAKERQIAFKQAAKEFSLAFGNW